MTGAIIRSEPNFRALAALATDSGRRVRADTIYRAGALRALDAADAAALDALGLVLVCDLRSESESDHAPSSWLERRDIGLVAHDVLARIPAADGPWPRLASDPTPAGARAAMIALYAAIPAAAGEHVVAIMRELAGGRVPALIHCTAGKDRTGFVTAMLLTVLGVSRAAILADYLDSAGRQTATAIEGTRVLAEDRIGQPVDEATIAVLMGVEADYLETSLAVIERDHGGVEAYLFSFGADAVLLADFRERLLD